MLRIVRWLCTLIAATFPACILGLNAAPALSKERYGIIIANEQYRHTSPVLYAKRDAEAVKQLFVDVLDIPRNNIKSFEDSPLSEILLLFGSEGRLGNIANMVKGEDSELYIYFAGHGSKEANKAVNASQAYLLATDSHPDNLELSAYPLDRLQQNLIELQKKNLPRGKVTLILESCFSGVSFAGDLISGRSAPALGPPPKLAKSERNEHFVVLAAAQENQYAAWDDETKQSVFTEALVSGLYGEADDARFGGDADGKVNLTELKSFLGRRVTRRMQSIRPGESQIPAIWGGKQDEVLADLSQVIGMSPFSEMRRHEESIRAARILARSDSRDVEKFLEECLYCPQQDQMHDFLRKQRQISAHCVSEKPFAEELLKLSTPSAIAEIEAFQRTCTCCERKAELEARIAYLRDSEGGSGTSAIGDDQDGGRPDGQLIRNLQSELKRIGCYGENIDGIWGRMSSNALERFNKETGSKLASLDPSEELLGVIAKYNPGACPLQCGAQFEARDGRCVRISCSGGRVLTASGRCVYEARRKQPSTAKRREQTQPRQRASTTQRRTTRQRVSEPRRETRREPRVKKDRLRGGAMTESACRDRITGECFEQ